MQLHNNQAAYHMFIRLYPCVLALPLEASSHMACALLDLSSTGNTITQTQYMLGVVVGLQEAVGSSCFRVPDCCQRCSLSHDGVIIVARPALAQLCNITSFLEVNCLASTCVGYVGAECSAQLTVLLVCGYGNVVGRHAQCDSIHTVWQAAKNAFW